MQLPVRPGWKIIGIASPSQGLHFVRARRHPGRSSIFRDRGVPHPQGPQKTPTLVPPATLARFSAWVFVTKCKQGNHRDRFSLPRATRSSREVARSEIIDFLNIKLRISRSSREVARSSREAIPVLETLGKSAPLPFSAQNTRKAGKFVRLRSCARVPSYRVRVDHVCIQLTCG